MLASERPMDHFSDVFVLILGWLLGALSPGLAAAIERPKQRTELIVAVARELHEIRYLLAHVLVLLRSKLKTMDQATLDLIKPLLLEYKGDEQDTEHLEATEKLLAAGDAAYIALHNAGSPTGRASYPVRYSTPLLDANAHRFGLFRLVTQQRLFRVLTELQLFNQQVEIVQRAHDRTFNSMSPENYAANNNNLVQGTVNLAVRATFLIRAINALVNSDGSPNDAR
jgi:hypothetical protein